MASVVLIRWLTLTLIRCRVVALRSGLWNRSRDILRCVIDIQLFVDGLRNRLDLGAKFLLDLVKVETIFPVNQVDGQAKVSEPCRIGRFGGGMFRRSSENQS